MDVESGSDFARYFSPENQPSSRAISLAMSAAITECGGLTSMCRNLASLTLHLAFAESTKLYVHELEDRARTQEVHTRDSGTVAQAIAAMCLRAAVTVDSLTELVHEGGMVAPMVFYSEYMDRYMASGDLTLYENPARSQGVQGALTDLWQPIPGDTLSRRFAAW